jgi:hypothetical protein
LLTYMSMIRALMLMVSAAGASGLGYAMGAMARVGKDSGKNACSSGLVYRRILPPICSLSRSMNSNIEACVPSGW